MPASKAKEFADGLNESCFVGKSRIKAMSKTHQPLHKRFDAVVCIPSIFPLVSKPEIEAHPRGHHEHRKRLTGVLDLPVWAAVTSTTVVYPR